VIGIDASFMHTYSFVPGKLLLFYRLHEDKNTCFLLSIRGDWSVMIFVMT
jgi:hypothetical protein